MDKDKQSIDPSTDPDEGMERQEPKQPVTLGQVIRDNAADAIHRGAASLLQMLVRGTLRALGLRLLAITENPTDQQDIDWDAIGGNGSRGPGWDIDKIITIGGGWEDEKRLPRLRRRSLEVYCFDKDIPRSTITDKAHQYRELFGDMPLQQVLESWIIWKERQKLSD